MAKYKKNKKIIKFLILVPLISLVVLGLLGTGSFYVITASAKLNTDSLIPKSSGVSILSASGEPLNLSFGLNDSSKIPDHTKFAFIAKEDKRFLTHSGVDIIRVLGALKSNIKNGEIVEGGSTITQQLIKNTHLTQDKTIKRKLNEIKLAKELEKTYSKEEILDSYLNTIYFGNNLFGIRSASSFYFGKEVKDLSIAESAILAGLISAPSAYNPITNESISKDKARMVIKLMNEQGYIDESDAVTAQEEVDKMVFSKKTIVGSSYINLATAEALEILGVETLPINQKVIIKTYMDETIQSHLDQMAESPIYKANDADGIMSDIGAILVDNKTGGIIAFGGSSKYNLGELKRQPASTIKPILVYGPAIEYDLISPASFVLDEPIVFGDYAPKNATKKTYGWTTIRDNIVRSTNIPAVKILNQTGIEKSITFAKKLGLEFDPADNNLAIALGGLNSGVTIKSLADAYSTLARGGFYTNSCFVDEITISGLRVYKNNPQKTQVMRDSTAYLLTDMLKSVAEYGTGRNIKDLNIPIASKTGTNAINDINHDGWNASYTTEHTAICWMGNTGPVSKVSSSQFNGSLYPTYFVRDLLKKVYHDHSPNDFIMPPSVQRIALDEHDYINHAVIRANPGETAIIEEVFATTNFPPEKPQDLTAISIEQLVEDADFELAYPNLFKKYGMW